MDNHSQISLQVINHWLNYHKAKQLLPGFQVSIRSGSNLIFDKAYGYSDLKKKELYTTSHLGRIASQSKMFTGALTLILESKGILNLKDKIVQYVPELLVNKDRRIKEITILDLLMNRSGLIRDSYKTNYWDTVTGFPTADELIREIAKTRLCYKPNTKTKYTNYGFGLLGVVLERATNESFSTLLEKYLTNHTKKLLVTFDYNRKIKIASGYLRDQSGRLDFKKVSHRQSFALAPAAGMCGNTASTTRFLSQLFFERNILSHKQNQILKSRRMPVVNLDSDKYGQGIIFAKVNGSEYVGHAGGFPGFTSQTWMVPKSKFTFGFITNVNALKTFHFIRGMYEIIKSIGSHFSANEVRSLIVSSPIADNYGSAIYVIGKKKAIAFQLDGDSPTDDTTIFTRHADRGYYCEKLSGYKAVGEPLRFEIVNGRVKSVRLGGVTHFPIRID